MLSYLLFYTEEDKGADEEKIVPNLRKADANKDENLQKKKKTRNFYSFLNVN